MTSAKHIPRTKLDVDLPRAPRGLVSLSARLLFGLGLLAARLLAVVAVAGLAAFTAWQVPRSWILLLPVILVVASVVMTWLWADLLPRLARRLVGL